MINLTWLNENRIKDVNVTWGVPWEKGILLDEKKVKLFSEKIEKEVQVWPMAHWPDGSIKWTGLATSFSKNEEKNIELKISDSKEKREEISGIKIEETSEEILVSTGKISCYIDKFGKNIIKKIIMENKTICHSGKLVILKENNLAINIKEEIRLESFIEKVSLEQKGKLRTVVKIEGIHKNHSEKKIPFILRLVFFKNSESIKIVHTFLSDIDPEKDFIKGIGIEFSTNLVGENFNKNIAFSLEEGIYSEASNLLLTRYFRQNNSLYENQIALKNIIKDEILENGKLIESARGGAVWNDFKLIQDSSRHYKIKKRSSEKVAYIDSLHGAKAQGLIYIKDEEKGIALGLKDFWQKNPSGLEIKNLSQKETTLTVWIYDPSGEVMDMRHYSEDHHMSAYEGFEELRSTPFGIANTSEVFIKCFVNTVDKNELYLLSKEWQEPSILRCLPEYYYQTKATGVWSLPSYETTEKAEIENQLSESFNFYKKERKQRDWYGYWNYGDIMHSYDKTRNQWMYDLGGYAWQNTELMPNLWLWYQFFRTGNKDVYKMVEAMTRHNSEVDCYHFGEYKGLGSRHNVIHWGCSCKEARISMAVLYKYYYYLTADERTGEIIQEFKDADNSVESLEPLRGFYSEVQKNQFYIRTGPDWSSYCSNWQTEWERTGDILYKEKILKGINYLKELPLRLLSGPTVLYNPKTNEMKEFIDKSKSEFHMMISFGAPQIWMEIAELIEDEDWKDMIAEFGSFYMLTDEEINIKTNGMLNKKQFSWPMFSASMVAYSANRTKDRELGKKVWKMLENELSSESKKVIDVKTVKTWRNLEEDPKVTTNCVAQWCLNSIVCLELIGDMISEKGE